MRKNKDRRTILSDEKLYELCQHYGKMARIYRQKFVGLLPEVNRRRLFEKKGFNSIFEFAAKLAGLSQEQVKRVLSLEKSFQDKPVLKEILVTGKISLNKLARVVSVANAENQVFLAQQVKILPQKALETLVRDVKNGQDVFDGNSDPKFVRTHKSEVQNGLFRAKDEADFVRVYKVEELKLSDQVIEKLTELQKKGIDINGLILEFLKKREKDIKAKKAEITEEQAIKQDIKITQKQEFQRKSGDFVSRYIPIKVRRIIQQEHGTKCAIPNCGKLAETLHHTARFALSQSHNPYFLAPLCREHHLIAHSIDANFRRKRVAAA